MPFTNVWDTTFPPDTQLANLLGQDLRNFRLDVQQRMGAISGLDAAKPAFNTDAQPANWNGVLFFATDTGKIYQWTNPAWNDITANILVTSNVIKTSLPAGSNTSSSTATIPANTFKLNNSMFAFDFSFTQVGDLAAHTATTSLSIGGTTVLSIIGPTNSNSSNFYVARVIFYTSLNAGNIVNARYIVNIPSGTQNGSLNFSNNGLFTFDITAPLAVVASATITGGGAGANWFPQQMQVFT